MIYITGDTHGDIDFEKLPVFAKEHPELTENDYLIIAGDFGGVWDKDSLEQDLIPYEKLPFTTLFVDGNHENFDLLETFPVEIWNGGKIHRIRRNIIHLMRGQVFDIEGKSFFTFGGASSHDKFWRTEGRSWWKQEVPTDADMCEANKNLEKVGFRVDYIVTHACDERALFNKLLLRGNFYPDIYPENGMLSYFEEHLQYKHWYFGHYHVDGDISDKKTALYDNIIPII